MALDLYGNPPSTDDGTGLSSERILPPDGARPPDPPDAGSEQRMPVRHSSLDNRPRRGSILKRSSSCESDDAGAGAGMGAQRGGVRASSGIRRTGSISFDLSENTTHVIPARPGVASPSASLVWSAYVCSPHTPCRDPQPEHTSVSVRAMLVKYTFDMHWRDGNPRWKGTGASDYGRTVTVDSRGHAHAE